MSTLPYTSQWSFIIDNSECISLQKLRLMWMRPILQVPFLTFSHQWYLYIQYLAKRGSDRFYKLKVKISRRGTALLSHTFSKRYLKSKFLDNMLILHHSPNKQFRALLHCSLGSALAYTSFKIEPNILGKVEVRNGYFLYSSFIKAGRVLYIRSNRNLTNTTLLEWAPCI